MTCGLRERYGTFDEAMHSLKCSIYLSLFGKRLYSGGIITPMYNLNVDLSSRVRLM